MTHRICPANTKIYDVLGAFNHSETYWPISSKVLIGDVVYIYLSAPFKQIGYICDVLQVNLAKENILEKVRPFLKNQEKIGKNEKMFMRLGVRSIVKLESNSLLAHHFLKENGLNGMIMGPRKLENNPTLLDYIQRNL